MIVICLVLSSFGDIGLGLQLCHLEFFRIRIVAKLRHHEGRMRCVVYLESFFNVPSWESQIPIFRG